MNQFEMVVLIVLIVTIGSIFKGRRQRAKGNAIADIVPGDAENLRMKEEIRTLKERIAVLERIATDNSSAVALDREIEKLR